MPHHLDRTLSWHFYAKNADIPGLFTLTSLISRSHSNRKTSYRQARSQLAWDSYAQHLFKLANPKAFNKIPCYSPWIRLGTGFKCNMSEGLTRLLAEMDNRWTFEIKTIEGCRTKARNAPE